MDRRDFIRSSRQAAGAAALTEYGASAIPLPGQELLAIRVAQHGDSMRRGFKPDFLHGYWQPTTTRGRNSRALPTGPDSRGADFSSPRYLPRG